MSNQMNNRFQLKRTIRRGLLNPPACFVIHLDATAFTEIYIEHMHQSCNVSDRLIPSTLGHQILVIRIVLFFSWYGSEALGNSLRSVIPWPIALSRLEKSSSCFNSN